MYISYDSYRVFYYVAKHKSFTQAAEVLLNNQPNITRTIKNLEAQLGCTLFIRSNRGVQLTPEGEKLYAHIRIAFEHIKAGEDELALDKSLHGGVITIGVCYVAVHCFLLPVLKRFRQLYPGIRIRLSNDSTPQALNALKNSLVDFAVVLSPSVTDKNFKERPLKTIHDVAVCGCAFSELAERPVSLRDLEDYPLISLPSSTQTHDFYTNLFTEKGIRFSPDIEAITAAQILPMVKNDLGIGFVPEDFIKSESDQNSFFVLDLKDNLPERHITLVKHSDRTLSIAAKELEKMIIASSEEFSK
ncbi:MAG: LysR family transcriptional regulator [Oscillospiraceae bacterium]|nr:LysR family transcriptional regulator [Oscillospiraceae bacterium]MBQ3048532.1 LysR family transcriptional regulator [Oscillospiraceae bacterium]MBQ9939659.1 LysR family transcriptional regulator [Oscillospiraceae bacterium]